VANMSGSVNSNTSFNSRRSADNNKLIDLYITMPTPNNSNDRASKGPFADSYAEFCTRWLWHSLGVSRLRRAIMNLMIRKFFVGM